MITDNRHQKILHLAWPMLLANSSGPLLGLVDTAVIGHLEHSYYLGGVAIGAMVVTFMLWLVGFLRMSTTALVAQARGAKSEQREFQVLSQGVIAALALSTLFLFMQTPIESLGFWAAGGSEAIQTVGREYYAIRIWSLPAAFCNLVLIGWLMGRQQAKSALIVTIALNLVNLFLDILFVWGWGWGVAGVAWASLIAEYFALILTLFMVWRLCGEALVAYFKEHFSQLFDKEKLAAFFSLNADIFIRTLCLEICFAFVTFQGARLGDDIVAANAVLMNFLLLISLGLDAVAYSAEVLVGYAKGAKKQVELLESYKLTLIWSTVFAGIYSLAFLFGGSAIIGIISSIPSVVETANDYMIWIILLPILAHWCYLYDGVFIGLTRAKEMRNSMVVSVFVVFFPVWWLFSDYGNHALWGALSTLMVARGITLALSFNRLRRDGLLLD